MTDHDEITRLLYLYAEAVDLGEFERLDDLFAQATYRTAGVDGVLRGDEVAVVMRRTVRLYDGRPRTKHLVTNVIIDIDASSTTARSRSYFTVVQGPPGQAPSVIITGRYHDAFEQVDGHWRFTDRLIHIDETGDLSAHLDLDRLGW